MNGENKNGVSVHVAAKIIGKSSKTIWRWAREGRIPYDRPSPRKTLISRSEAEALRQEE